MALKYPTRSIKEIEMTDKLKSDRIFSVYEYQMSHQQVLIRGHRAAQMAEDGLGMNLDLVFQMVAYVSIPTIFYGLELDDATEEEVHQAREKVGRDAFKPEWVRILVTAGKRYMVVAPHVSVFDNNWSSTDSHFLQRMHYRGLEPDGPIQAVKLSSTIDGQLFEFDGQIFACDERNYLIHLPSPINVEGKKIVGLLAVLSRPASSEPIDCRMRFLEETDIPFPYKDPALQFVIKHFGTDEKLQHGGTIELSAVQ